MSLESTKITGYATSITALPDKMVGKAAQLKAAFDARTDAEVKTQHNALVDALMAVADANSGADNIGVTAVTGRTGATVQSLLEAEAAAEIAHEKRVDNPHAVTKNQVGLGSVDNTADANKPVSTAQAAAIAAHANRTDNPHSVTAAQAGAYTKAETDSAIDTKVIAIGAGDMTKAVYDPDGDGIVDDAEKLGGVLPNGYATAAQGAEADALVAGTTPAGNATKFGGALPAAYATAEQGAKADTLAAGAVYSTTEVNTGKTWIDGKTIYRKVFTSVLPTTAENYADMSISVSTVGYSKIVKLDCGVITPTGEFQPAGFPFYLLTDTSIAVVQAYSLFAYTLDKAISVKYGHFLVGDTVVITMEYTK